MAETIETTDVKTLTANTATSALTGKAVAIYDKTSGDASAYDGSTLKSQLDKADSAYQKPGTGIPKTDLADAVQTSLGKADSALQAHQDISGKANRDTDAVKDNIAKFDGNGNAVDSGINEYELAKKAACNPTMTSGYSGGMIVPDAIGAKDEVLYRLSEKDRISQITKFEGKTVAWNVLSKNGNFTDGTTGWRSESTTYTNFSISSGECHVISSNGGYGIINESHLTPPGHKVYYRLTARVVTSGASIVLRNTGNSGTCYISNSTYSTSSNIFTLTDNSNELIVSGGSGSIEYYVKDIFACDITLLYGSEIEGLTDEQIIAKFESEFPGYHDYNPGELISNDASGIETVGFNLWDEETLLGYYASNGNYDHTNDQLCSKNLTRVIPGGIYYIRMANPASAGYLEFDANGNFLRRLDCSQTITISSDAYFIKFNFGAGYGSTYNHDICINLSDSSRNGQYEPYRKSVLPLNLDSFKVKDGQGNITTITGGLKSAGSIYDEIVGNKFIKRVGSVDLGSLSWTYGQEYDGYFFSYTHPVSAKSICSVYENNPNFFNSPYKDKCFINYPYFQTTCVRDGSFNGDAAAFKTAMSGVMLYYELSTPQVYELVDDLPAAYPEYEGGYVRVLGDSPRMPLTAYFSYSKTTKEINNNILDLQSRSIAEGIADSISAGTQQEFVFRQSGGDGVNYMKRIKGKTLAWNQMCNTPSGGSNENVDTRDGFSPEIWTTLYGNEASRIDALETHTLSENNFKISAIITFPSGSYDGILFKHDGQSRNLNMFSATGSIAGHKYLVSCFIETCDVTSVGGLQWKDCKVIDLTLMFGAGNEPTTVEEFEAMFPLPYYPYNPGELISNDASALETVGFNLWDEEWEAGTLSGVNGQPVSGFDDTRIRSKNYYPCFPNTAYNANYVGGSYASNYPRIFWYDANKNYISPTASAGVSTSPANAAFFRISTEGSTYGNIYNHDICINLSDSSRNGQYEPYWKRKIELGLHSFQVRNPQTGEVMTINGLKSAGSVYDEIVGNKYIRRVGSVDLGTLAWNHNDDEYTYGYWVANIPTKKAGEGTLIAQKYSIVAASQISGDNNYASTICGFPSNKDIVCNSGIVGAAPTGYVNYILETPIEYELVKPIQNAILVDSDGVEKAIYPTHSDGSPSAPFNCDSNYSISIPKLLAKLND